MGVESTCFYFLPFRDGKKKKKQEQGVYNIVNFRFTPALKGAENGS
ncbi:hypothetical protein SAMN05444355_11832 [Flavobacterium frigoris]|uniref:Uncharacterized protein n=1 Tax=Flavobacterium frigoris TaxID=229204 RepID=A0A1H9QY62_FLAFI|nr:hypothetical protein SAMN05444355_11832 [Flavobacterium frigoris]